jgi:hypothetical protein
VPLDVADLANRIHAHSIRSRSDAHLAQEYGSTRLGGA